MAWCEGMIVKKKTSALDRIYVLVDVQSKNLVDELEGVIKVDNLADVEVIGKMPEVGDFITFNANGATVAGLSKLIIKDKPYKVIDVFGHIFATILVDGTGGTPRKRTVNVPRFMQFIKSTENAPLNAVDIASLIDIALDAKDELWFNELCARLNTKAV